MGTAGGVVAGEVLRWWSARDLLTERPPHMGYILNRGSLSICIIGGLSISYIKVPLSIKREKERKRCSQELNICYIVT